MNNCRVRQGENERMIKDTIAEIEARIRTANIMTGEKKTGLLNLLSELELAAYKGQLVILKR